MLNRFYQPIVERLNQVQGLQLNLAALNSDYWGQTLTVTGLLTGTDLVNRLQERDLGDALFVPTLMLKHGTEQFLDDMTVSQVSDQLNIPIYTVGGGPGDLIDRCLELAQ